MSTAFDILQDRVRMNVLSPSTSSSFHNERGDLTPDDVVAFSKDGTEKGNVLSALKAETQLMRQIHAMVADATAQGNAGEKLVIDLERVQSVRDEEGLAKQEISDTEAEAIMELRHRLFKNEGIRLVLTGLKPETEKKLRAMGMEQEGLEMVSKSGTRAVFEKPKKEETPVDQAA